MEIGKRGPLSSRILCGLCFGGGGGAGNGAIGEVVPAGELKGKGDLFYRKGEKEPFTGTAVSQVAGKNRG